MSRLGDDRGAPGAINRVQAAKVGEAGQVVKVGKVAEVIKAIEVAQVSGALSSVAPSSPAGVIIMPKVGATVTDTYISGRKVVKSEKNENEQF